MLDSWGIELIPAPVESVGAESMDEMGLHGGVSESTHLWSWWAQSRFQCLGWSWLPQWLNLIHAVWFLDLSESQ